MSYTLQQLGWKPFFQQQISLDELDDFYPARVAEIQRGHITLWSEQGEQTLVREHFKRLAALAVGDWMLVSVTASYPERVLTRQNIIKRKAAGTERAEQFIAANVDTLLIVTSCNHDFNEARLERYLSLALEAGVMPLLVLTKVDLVHNIDDFIQRAQALHHGVLVEAVNALDRNTLQGLASWCGEGQTLALVGSSGVGKSTLVNSLTGSHQTTNEIRHDDSHGRHTTTARSLHWLSEGGLLMDTPGMRELQLADCEQGIDSVFDDVSQYLGQCRFTDCQHDTEPGCAIKQAIESGQLSLQRWLRYQKLQQEQARNTASLAEKRLKDRKLGQYYKSVLQEKVQRKKQR